MRYLITILFLIISSMITTAQDESADRLLYSYTTNEGEGHISAITQADGAIQTLLSFSNQSVRCFWASADGSVLAYGLVDNQVDDISTQPMTYYVDDLDDSTPLFTYNNLQIRNCPAWSADEQSFALLDGNTFKYGVYGQNELMTIQTFDIDVSESANGTVTGNSIYWSPEVNNSILLAVDLFGDIYTLDMTFNLRQLTDTPDIVEHIVSWSDTGVYFAIQTRATLQPEENIYTAIYNTVYDGFWFITDDFDGTNITESIGWLADSDTYFFRQQSGDAIYYAANADTQNLSSQSQTLPTPITGVTISPDGETLIYARDIQRNDDNTTYSFELMRQPFAAGGTRLFGDDYTDDGIYVQSLYAIQSLPNRDDIVITLQRESEQYSSIVFDAENRTFTSIFETEFGAFHSAPTISTSHSGAYLSYETQTNNQLFGSESDYHLSIVDISSGASQRLVTQPYNWDNPYPRPIVKWVSE